MTGPTATAESNARGRLVLVVGPSGAGKDTLIDLVRARCDGDTRIVFPRRTVTRETSPHEAILAATPAEFMAARARGDFVLDWEAHGLGYGVPRSIVDDAARGCVVVVNVSRTVIAAARDHFARVTVVLVTARPEILAARLAARARGSDGDLGARLKRSEGLAAVAADVTINNIGVVADHAEELLAVVRRGLT